MLIVELPIICKTDQMVPLNTPSLFITVALSSGCLGAMFKRQQYAQLIRPAADQYFITKSNKETNEAEHRDGKQR